MVSDRMDINRMGILGGGIMEIKMTVNKQRLEDLLCTALEGGCDHWARIKKGTFAKGKSASDYEYWHLEAIFDGGTIIVQDYEDSDTKAEIGLDELMKGLQLLASNYPEHYCDWLREDDDGETGDIFLQLTCFGEVMFG